MFGKRAHKTGSGDWTDEAFFAQAVEAPTAGLPAAEKMRRRAKWIKGYIWTAVVLLPFALFTVIAVVIGTVQNSGPETPATADEFARTRPVAISATQDWLNSTTPPLPGGRFVSWDNATQVDVDISNPQDDKPIIVQAERHSLTVASAEKLYTVVVRVDRSANHGVRAIGEPGLLPVAKIEAQEWPNIADWDDSIPVGRVDDAAETAINTWLRAYTGQDSDELRQTVGDPNGQHSYLPLTGVVPIDFSIGSVGSLWTKKKSTDEDTPPDRMIVRITFGLAWGAEPDPDLNTTLPRVSYDLLLTDTNTASPRVVAWGGPGSGPSLKPYSNAVSYEGALLYGSGTETENGSDPEFAPESQEGDTE